MRSRALAPLRTPLALALALAAPEASAQQGASRVALRAELGAGQMIPSLQRADGGYDGLVLQATGRLAVNLVSWLSLQASVHNGFYLSSQQDLGTGRTLAVQLGLRVEPEVGSVGRLWIDGNPGFVSTGTQRRFGFDAGLGFELRAAAWLGLGPFARYHFVSYEEGVNAPSAATAVTFGLSLTLRAPRATEAHEQDRDADGVSDADDLCATVPQGPSPDPARRGCPRPDRDHDGVFDDEDRCADTPAGPHPDSARRGCPTPDTDTDGVFDDEDQCVDTPQGTAPDPSRRGCPDGDDDQDGVLNTVDLCRRVPQGLSPDPSRIGCPLPDRDQDAVSDPEDRCPDQPGMPRPGTDRNGCPGEVILSPGQIHITQPVFFATNADAILPQSFPVLTAVRDVLRVVPTLRRVSVEGHTDDVGDDAANLDLSNRRAASVARWLAESGIAPERLEAHGYGETRPLRPIEGLRRRRLRDAQAINRRVEFRVVDPPAPAEVQSTTPAEAPPQEGRHHRRRRRHH